MKLTSMLYGIAAVLFVAWLVTGVAGIQQVDGFGGDGSFGGSGLDFWDYVIFFGSGAVYLIAAVVALTGGAIIRAMTEPYFDDKDDRGDDFE